MVMVPPPDGFAAGARGDKKTTPLAVSVANHVTLASPFREDNGFWGSTKKLENRSPTTSVAEQHFRFSIQATNPVNSPRDDSQICPSYSQRPPGRAKRPSSSANRREKARRHGGKNVDVTDVQQGLEELNKEIIRGGVIKEKASEDLFALDTAGDSRLEKKFPKHIKKGLKADEIINARSAVPAVSMRKRPGEKTTNGLLPVKRQRTDWVSHKELSRLKRIADGQHDNTVQVKDATYDLWDMPAALKETDVDDFLEEETKAKVPKSMKQQPISLLDSGKQVPAVQKPSGGYSYNPMFTDYEQRLAFCDAGRISWIIQRP
ncbi:hypothetical protein NM208_g11121 [Fusarium decemcellulare]|uniref:Uncharacterized protein n=1 Tax=Fusarium decemcellulare TaxID=57161 RepID=A0ACC1RVJ4_9HYPO|nr:hypothetical protein NM208_g11121 [Fusarium decemcellulare]